MSLDDGTYTLNVNLDFGKDPYRAMDEFSLLNTILHYIYSIYTYDIHNTASLMIGFEWFAWVTNNNQIGQRIKR